MTQTHTHTCMRKIALLRYIGISQGFFGLLEPSHQDQCTGLPGDDIRKNPIKPSYPSPFELSYGLKLTEQRYCVTRIATLASYFLRTAGRLLRPLSTARDAEAPDGPLYRCLLSGFYQTGLDRPTFSWELLSNLFGIFPHLFLE